MEHSLLLFICLFIFNGKTAGTGKTVFKKIENNSMKQNSIDCWLLTFILYLNNNLIYDIIYSFFHFNNGAF